MSVTTTLSAHSKLDLCYCATATQHSRGKSKHEVPTCFSRQGGEEQKSPNNI